MRLTPETIELMKNFVDFSPNTLEVYLAADSVFEQNNTPAFIIRRGVAAALIALAHNVDWESGDPKFLVLDIAKELDDQYR